MSVLNVKVKDKITDKHYKYKNRVNPSDPKILALILGDLKNLGMPIDRAIIEFRSENSDWDIALGLD